MQSSLHAASGQRRISRAEAAATLTAFAIFVALGIICWFSPYVFWPWGIYFTKSSSWVFWGLAVVALAAPFLLRPVIKQTHPVFARPVVLLILLFGAKTGAVGVTALDAPDELTPGSFEAPEDPHDEGARRLDFVLAGDIHTPNHHTETLIRQAAALHDDSSLEGFFMLGDNFPEENPFDVTVRWAFEMPFFPLRDRDVPFYFVLGNHEYIGGLVEAQINHPEFNMHGRKWYSTTFGDGLVTFFILDTEEFIRSPEQLFWIRERLERDNSRWRILLMHKPMTSFENGGRGLRPMASKLLADAIEESGGIDLVITGHTNHYERFLYRDRIKHVISSGTTAVNHNPSRSNKEYIIRNTEDRNMGHLVVTPEELAFRAFGKQGQTIDEFTVDAPTRPEGGYSAILD